MAVSAIISFLIGVVVGALGIWLFVSLELKRLQEEVVVLESRQKELMERLTEKEGENVSE